MVLPSHFPKMEWLDLSRCTWETASIPRIDLLISRVQAKNDGADLIEFDVALTKDGEAVLLHDDDLDRTTDLSGPIREKTLAQLAPANISANFIRTTYNDCRLVALSDVYRNVAVTMRF